MAQVASIILAAGKGTRMKSRLPKVLHRVCGRPMLEHVILAAREAGIEKNTVVIGHGAEAVQEAIGSVVQWVLQADQMGTGHAVMQAEPLLGNFDGSILVLCGDTPLITTGTLASLLREHEASGNSATVLTAVMEDPAGYGRVIRNGQGQVQAIIEHRDATDEQLCIKEINTGMYCFSGKKLFAALKKISPANAQGEYYLTDVLFVLGEEGEPLGAVIAEDPSETMGINNRVQLAEAEKRLRLRIMTELMMEGVTIIDPLNTYIDSSAVIGPDSVVYPGSFIEGNCSFGENCHIGPYSRLRDVQCGSDTTIVNSVVLESTIGNGVNIGPYAYIRPGTVLGNGVKIGDFVEIKKSLIGDGSKVPHLSYVGDAEVGERVNVGAGTITCNYDGSRKSKTIIGDNAFIGSNTNLVAPVEVGSNAVVGAGSTITKSIPDGALSVERSKQAIYPDWAIRKNNKK